ncbi:hypothetical protein [Odoribacter splanchnicus]|uniref:hypothetical protein n=1 Tax=Odoribacter splanchnicus TaxID=28118 RepID=UPI000B3A9E48|nr:hypothetical protein [Odoribacter splanchnicus]OUO14089.1 hypothetical protein B5F93_08470 [Odoribacter splanchnicus]
MKTVTVKPNQTVFDILVEQYGTCEALAELLENNPNLENEPGADGRAIPEAERIFRLDLPLKDGSTVLISTDSRQIKTSVIREINTEVTTFSNE